jgi:hypothetical protein
VYEYLQIISETSTGMRFGKEKYEDVYLPSVSYRYDCLPSMNRTSMRMTVNQVWSGKMYEYEYMLSMNRKSTSMTTHQVWTGRWWIWLLTKYGIENGYDNLRSMSRRIMNMTTYQVWAVGFWIWLLTKYAHREWVWLLTKYEKDEYDLHYGGGAWIHEGGDHGCGWHSVGRFLLTFPKRKGNFN